jgi:hypothetical protein
MQSLDGRSNTLGPVIFGIHKDMTQSIAMLIFSVKKKSFRIYMNGLRLHGNKFPILSQVAHLSLERKYSVCNAWKTNLKRKLLRSV